MAWHIVEKFIEQVGAHSTLIGKFWTTFFFVLRFLMVVSIGDTVFDDERDEFHCNTLTPGCENVCFNDFSPISLVRLWALQVLAVALPTISFMVYIAHKMEKISQAKKIKEEEQEKKKKKKEEARKMVEEYRRKAIAEKFRMQSGEPPGYNGYHAHEVEQVSASPEAKKEEKKDDKKEEKKDEDDCGIVATKLDSDTPPRLLLAYVLQVVARLAIEAGFMIVQYNTYVYKFWVPEIFKCSRFPCTNAVDCFIDRPKEKTIMIWIMFATALIMIALNIVELYHLGLKKIWVAWKTRDNDITKQYKVDSNSLPQFRHQRYRGGYPQAVGIRVGYARSSLSGGGGADFEGDQYI